ncbi:MAG: TolC family protein [Bacteroidales bacterium]|nr:TolC family protein [Bacteroidales bacterium]
MKNLSALIFGLALLLTGYSAQAQETWSLQHCIDYALENNIQIKQQALNTAYGQNQVDQAKSDRLPNLNAGLSNNLNYGRSLNYDNTYSNVNSAQYNASLSTNITLWNGFRLQNTVKQRALDLQATIEDLNKAKDDVILNVAAAYLEILFAEELELVSQAQIEVTQQQINRTQQLVDAESLARGALFEIEAQLAREELKLVNDKIRTQLAYLALYQFLELPVEESFKIKKPDLPAINTSLPGLDLIEIYSKALQLRPEIKAAGLRVESANKQLEIANAYKYPSLSFAADYYNLFNNQYTDFSGESINFFDQLANNKRYGMGLTLNIPIFNRFQVKNNISNSKLQISDYEYRLQKAKNDLRADIELAYTNALASLNRYFSSEKALSSMKEAFRYTEEEFNEGLVNTVEYNQSKNNLTTAQSDLLQSKYEYIFRTKILDFYKGIPIEL